MNTKKRYIPDPQVEPIALTEEQLRQLVREEVAKALAPIKQELASAVQDYSERRVRLQYAAAQCRREVMPRD